LKAYRTSFPRRLQSGYKSEKIGNHISSIFIFVKTTQRRKVFSVEKKV